jgi:hypothetical protein
MSGHDLWILKREDGFETAKPSLCLWESQLTNQFKPQTEISERTDGREESGQHEPRRFNARPRKAEKNRRESDAVSGFANQIANQQWERLQCLSAAVTLVQGHAGVSWHDFGRLIPTRWAASR